MSERYEGRIDALWQASPQLALALPADPAYRFRRVAAGAPAAGDTSAEARVLVALGSESLAAHDIANACGIAGDALAALLDRMFSAALIAIDGDVPLPAGPCYRHLHAYAAQVAAALGVPDLRRRIALERSDAVLRLGAYVEEYHYIRAAPDYLASAVASASGVRQRRILGEYFADEFWHDGWVAQGLHAAGIDEAELARAQPLPSTLALLNLLRCTAAADLPALCVCLGAAEGTPESLPDIDAEFGALRDSGLLPAAVWAPFERHARIDAEHSHGSLFAEVFVDLEWVGAATRERIRDTVWQYWYAYRGFYEGIVGYYAGRPSLALFSFR